MSLAPGEVEAVERDTVAAVGPREVLEMAGWLVPLEAGTIGRAKSAVPLSHDVGPQAIGAIEAAYRDQGLPPAFRVADLPGLASVQAELAARSYQPLDASLFKVGEVSRLGAFSESYGRLLRRPDAAWINVFLGDGFDPADGAYRIEALGRAATAYGAAGDGAATEAVGVVSFGEAWAGVHGMRTAPAHRGKGHAAAVLAALGRAAADKGLTRVCLQVTEANETARRLYRRAGFTRAWRYHHWRKD